MDDNLMDLGTEFDIVLGPLSNNAANYTVEQLIAALEATTTLTELTFQFRDYEPTPENMRRVIEPLCRCISTLFLYNAQHPLHKVILDSVKMAINGMRDIFKQFLVAAKQFGISCLELYLAFDLPILVLVDFCRDNKSLKVLELKYVSFSGGASGLPLPLNNGPQNNSVILTLDQLTLYVVSFKNSTAATVFANLIARVNVSCLELDEVTAGEDEGEEDDIDEITERNLSKLKLPSVEQLTLYSDCRMEHFKAALDAGTTTVTDLVVDFDCGEDDTTARLEFLASFIRRAVKLNNLTIRRGDLIGPRISLPPHLFQALESCATVMPIQGIRDHGSDTDIVPYVSPDEELQLQKIASRNRELDRFATNPGTYPAEELPELMLQFENCPTGRYMLARRLPEILPFAELYAMHLSRRRTNPPTPKKSKLH